MHEKRIGNIEVTAYTDSESVALKFWCNSSVFYAMTLRSNEDLADLRYAIECVMNERARVAAQRRDERTGAGHE